MSGNRAIGVNRFIVLTVLATVVAGCGESLRTTTYDPRRSCEAFAGRYVERDGTCRAGGQ
jgi:hypothetical protein